MTYELVWEMDINCYLTHTFRAWFMHEILIQPKTIRKGQTDQVRLGYNSKFTYTISKEFKQVKRGLFKSTNSGKHSNRSVVGLDKSFKDIPPTQLGKWCRSEVVFRKRNLQEPKLKQSYNAKNSDNSHFSEKRPNIFGDLFFTIFMKYVNKGKTQNNVFQY